MAGPAAGAAGGADAGAEAWEATEECAAGGDVGDIATSAMDRLSRRRRHLPRGLGNAFELPSPMAPVGAVIGLAGVEWEGKGRVEGGGDGLEWSVGVFQWISRDLFFF